MRDRERQRVRVRDNECARDNGWGGSSLMVVSSLTTDTAIQLDAVGGLAGAHSTQLWQ